MWAHLKNNAHCQGWAHLCYCPLPGMGPFVLLPIARDGPICIIVHC
jgi:hypothetical protein